MNDEFNLLPMAFRQRELLRRRLRQWSAVWAVTAFVCAVGAAGVHWSGQHLRDRVRDLETACVPLRERAQQSRQLKADLQEFTGRQTLLAELDQSQQPVQVLGIVSQCALATGARLHVEHLQLTQEVVAVVASAAKPGDKTGAAKTPPAPPLTRRRLILVGLATDDLAVARFLAALRSAAVFHAVDLASTARVTHPIGHAQHYEVHCVF